MLNTDYRTVGDGAHTHTHTHTSRYSSVLNTDYRTVGDGPIHINKDCKTTDATLPYLHRMITTVVAYYSIFKGPVLISSLAENQKTPPVQLRDKRCAS